MRPFSRPLARKFNYNIRRCQAALSKKLIPLRPVSYTHLDQKLVIEISRVIRVGFLQQNAFRKDDTYVPLEKQLKMMQVILYLYDKYKALVSKGIPMSTILQYGLFEKLIKMKYEVPNDHIEHLDTYFGDIEMCIRDRSYTYSLHCRLRR